MNLAGVFNTSANSPGARTSSSALLFALRADETNDEVIVASDRFHEFGAEPLLLARMAGKRILLPERKECWPDKTHLAWHRAKKLEGK